MKYNKIKLYIIEFILTIILFFALVVSNRISNITLALILSIFAILISSNLKKRKILSTNSKEVNFLLAIFSLLYIGLFYLLGLWLFGFTNSSILFSFKTIYRFILPLIIIIISSEVIRMTLLSQEDKIILFKKKFNLIKVFTFIDMVLIDLLVFARVYDLYNLSDFLIVVGFILFSSISCNLFFNYICASYGISGIIIYRIITTIYSYIIPYIPDIYIMFRTFFRMMYPYIMYLILESTYSKTNFAISYSEKKQNRIAITIFVVLMTLLMMLISCKFKYGMLVIGSKSMTGTINKGDAIIYEEYKTQKIVKGQIIVFHKNGLRLVHRVVSIQNINGKTKYITKGDANKDEDSGYLLDKDIIGLVKLKVVYIGYPTIWLNDLFK